MKNYFEWSDEHSLGIQVIDDQHKKLIQIMHKLFTAINEQSTSEVIEEILNKLVEYTEYHFTTEEDFFRAFHYAEMEEHVNEHERFYEKIKTLQEKQEGNEIEVSFELMDFLEDWLLEHIQHLDKKYVACFKEHGVK